MPATHERDRAPRTLGQERIHDGPNELARIAQMVSAALRAPVARQFEPVSRTQQIREIHLGHLEELVAAHAVERHARAYRTRAPRERPMPHLECVRERIVAARRPLGRTLEKRKVGDAHPLHIHTPPLGSALDQLILATRIVVGIADRHRPRASTLASLLESLLRRAEYSR